MMADYIIAHDLGTSGNKATLFDDTGHLVDSIVFSYNTNYIDEHHIEQNPSDWWDAVCKSSKSLIQKTGINSDEVKVISFSGQMMGCLCVDKNGIPLRNSIIWADQRAQKQSVELNEKIDLQDFYKITGHRNTASYGLQKLMWIRDNQPDIYKNTYKVLNAKDYMVYKLTGNYYTDYSDATSMECFDINNFKWSERIIEASGIEYDLLPEAKESVFVAGNVTRQAALETGLSVNTVVVVGAGDGVCANVGAGSCRPGKTFSYVGSSAWIATTALEPIFDENMKTVTWPHAIPGLYAPNGTVQSAGSSYSWFKENVCGEEIKLAEETDSNVYELINRRIEKSPPGANGVIYMPYLLGERAPRWNPDAKACFLGIKMQNDHNDLARSVLEGITMNMSIILDTFRKKLDIRDMLVIGGGAKGKVWQQIMADIYECTINVPVLLEEATSMGAAVIGGVGAGIFKDFDVIDDLIEIDSSVVPIEDNMAVYKKNKEIFEECYQALTPLFGRL